MDWENYSEKLKKKLKNKSRRHCREWRKNHKREEKAYFCSSTLSSIYFKIRAKNFHAAKPLAFSLHFLFRRDQSRYFNLTSKIMKICEQILKKDSDQVQFEFFEL